MKKFLKKLLPFVLALVTAVSFVGCDAFTKDEGLVKNQTVAVVKIDGTGDLAAPYEEKFTVITNEDVSKLYASYGATYMYYYGLSAKDTLETILDGQIENLINLQKAVLYFNAYTDPREPHAAFPVDTTKDKWDIERYLSADEIVDANYQVKYSINEFIDDYVKESDDASTYTGTVRTAPTDAAKHTVSLTNAQKAAYTIDVGVANGGAVNNADRRSAYQKLLKSMETAGYIGKDFDWKTDDITDTEYFKDAVYEVEQQTLLNKYDRYLTYDVYAGIDIFDLADYYEDLYENQKSASDDYECYVELLGNASAKSPVVYNPFDGKSFGYVYNLLLGVDKVQEDEISKLDEKKLGSDSYREQRNAILLRTTAKDLRDTWITAGYDFSFDDKLFLNDYALASDSLPYQGTVVWKNKGDYQAEAVSDENGDYFKYYTEDGGSKVYDEKYQPKYSAESKLFTVSEFVTMMNGYLYGGSAPEMAGSGSITVTGKGAVPYYDAVFSDTAVTEWDEKINELLFAFSTDAGSLNTYKGYTVDEGYETSYTETYVTEFAAAARKLLEEGKKSSYIIVGTDYGYHVIFYSELISFDTPEGCDTLTKYLDKIGVEDPYTAYGAVLDALRDGDTDSVKDEYLYLLQQAYASTEAQGDVSKAKSEVVKACREDENRVKVYSSRLENLL